MAIQSFWINSAKSIGSIRCLRANHPPESLRGKLAGGGPDGGSSATVVNLMDALRRSVQAERPAAEKGKAAEKVGRQSGKRKAG